MGKVVSALKGIELNKKIDLFSRLILSVDIQEEPMDYFKTGCMALSAIEKIFEKYFEQETDPQIFEGAKDQIIAILFKKAADIQEFKINIPENIVKAKFNPEEPA